MSATQTQTQRMTELKRSYALLQGDMSARLAELEQVERQRDEARRELEASQARELALRGQAQITITQCREYVGGQRRHINLWELMDYLEQAITQTAPPVISLAEHERVKSELPAMAQKLFEEMLERKLTWLAGCEEHDGKLFSDNTTAELAGFLRDMRLHVGSAYHGVINAAALRMEAAEKDAADLVEAYDAFRDAVLEERGALAEENAPVNTILGELDAAFDTALLAHNARVNPKEVAG